MTAAVADVAPTRRFRMIFIRRIVRYGDLAVICRKKKIYIQTIDKSRPASEVGTGKTKVKRIVNENMANSQGGTTTYTEGHPS